MGSKPERDPNQPKFETSLPADNYSTSCEQPDTWFLGSLIPVKRPRDDLSRRASLHNHITMVDTKYDERLQCFMVLASRLGQFFPYKWLIEIAMTLHKIDYSQLAIKTGTDRVGAFLGYIELYLTFRGLSLLNSTLTEINASLDVSLTMHDIRAWKLKLIRIIPGLRYQWAKIRAQTHQTALFSTVVHVMNTELVLRGCSKEQIFHVKQACLRLTRDFLPTKKAKFIKNAEIWARAICAKAVQDILPDHSSPPFPDLPPSTQKVISNKRWQLEQVLAL